MSLVTLWRLTRGSQNHISYPDHSFSDKQKDLGCQWKFAPAHLFGIFGTTKANLILMLRFPDTRTIVDGIDGAPKVNQAIGVQLKNAEWVLPGSQ